MALLDPPLCDQLPVYILEYISMLKMFLTYLLTQAIREDAVLKERVLRAYKMMLGFYGLVLEDDDMGKVGPSDLFEKQMEHLNS